MGAAARAVLAGGLAQLAIASLKVLAVAAVIAIVGGTAAAGFLVHRARKQPLIVVPLPPGTDAGNELGDDTIAMLRGGTEPMDTVGAEADDMVRKGRRNG